MKKQIIALLIMLLIGLACWADGLMINSYKYASSYETPAYVNSTTGSGADTSSTVASSAFSVSAGNAIIVGVSNYTSIQRTVSSISDTAGNTYVRCGNRYQPDSYFTSEVWAAYNTTANANNVITVTYSGGATYRAMVAHQVSGIATSSAFDKQAASTGSPSSASVGPTDTTTQGAEYIFAFFMVSDSMTGTAGTNYTERVDADQIYSEDRVVTSTGAYSASATFSTSGDAYWAMISTFKAKAL